MVVWTALDAAYRMISPSHPHPSCLLQWWPPPGPRQGLRGATGATGRVEEGGPGNGVAPLHSNATSLAEGQQPLRSASLWSYQKLPCPALPCPPPSALLRVPFPLPLSQPLPARTAAGPGPGGGGRSLNASVVTGSRRLLNSTH